MSLANDDPEIFERLTTNEIIAPLVGIAVPIKTLSSGARLDTANRLRLSLSEKCGKLSAYVLLKQAEAIIADAIDIQREDAMRVADRKAGECLGAKYEIKGVRKWEYDDTVLDSLNAEAKRIAYLIKARKWFLESFKEEVANVTTGEIIKPAKLVQDGTNISITLPK